MNENGMNDNRYTGGVRVSIEFQRLIISLLNKGVNPSAIAFGALAIGAGMIVKQQGHEVADEIVKGMMKEARDGRIDLCSALLAAKEDMDLTQL
jgi:hypothetical protein